MSQEKFFSLTELPHFGRFSKNLMRRRFCRAIFFSMCRMLMNQRALRLRAKYDSNIYLTELDEAEYLHN